MSQAKVDKYKKGKRQIRQKIMKKTEMDASF